jgi:hypothetical protein
MPFFDFDSQPPFPHTSPDMPTQPAEFCNVTAVAKANIYFDIEVKAGICEYICTYL